MLSHPMIRSLPPSLILLALIGSGQGASASTEPPPPHQPARFAFSRSVVNLEYLADSLSRTPPASGVVRRPETMGDLWYGQIMRRLPGEGLRQSDHYVSFIAEYVRGVPSRAWCDENLDGDPTNDPAMKLLGYPGIDGARAFLTDLRWGARFGARDIPIDWKVRVVLHPVSRAGRAPGYRVQMVFAMEGTVTLAGKPHRALLFDGNGDGLLTKDFGDGVFVDLDDDLHFEIDPLSPGFGPLGVPFQMGHRTYEVVSVDPEGRDLSLVETGGAHVSRSMAAGEPAPEFAFTDTVGRKVTLSGYRGRVVLLYFWASWCGACRRQAPELEEIYDRYHARGLEIVGVSFDTDRAAMEDFHKSHHENWPTSFSGHIAWEDPIGRLYGVTATGIVYLVDREGRLDGAYTKLGEISARVEEWIPAAAPASR